MIEFPQVSTDQSIFDLWPKIEHIRVPLSFPLWQEDRDLQKFISKFTAQHQSTYQQNILSDENLVIDKSAKRDLMTEICSFRALRENWDGYGAVPLEVESTANALFIISELDEIILNKIEEIYPNPHGTVSAEWNSSNGALISLEIGNNTMSYYVEHSNGSTEFFDNISINVSEIEKMAFFILEVFKEPS